MPGMGTSCAVTALPLLIPLMETLEIQRQPLGQRILRDASLDDIAIWGVLALILIDRTRAGRQGLFLRSLEVGSSGPIQGAMGAAGERPRCSGTSGSFTVTDRFPPRGSSDRRSHRG